MAGGEQHPDDIFATGPLSALLWTALAAVFLLDFVLELGPLVESVLWASVLTVYGVACVSNARRCGRIHCYVTGPFLLTAALLVLLLGVGLLDFGQAPGRWLVPAIVVGFLLGRYLPERLWGRYRTDHRQR